MPATKIIDVIVPEVFNPYVIQKTAELSALVQSGIIVNNPELDRLATAGGRLINMPVWNDLTGDDEVLSDAAPLGVGKITSGQDVAALIMRGKAWGVNDLATALSGDDPMAAIGTLVAEYWARMRQKTLLSALEGVFSAASMAVNTHDISALVGDLACLTSDSFVDASQKLGDNKDKLTGVMMHSMSEASLVKQGLITYEVEAVEGSTMRVKKFLGKTVIVDDNCPVPAAGTYVTYLFGAGAFGLGNGAAPVPTETDRDSLAGEDVLINRQHFVLHPRGVKFLDAVVAGKSPTNPELATAANWLRVYEPKNVRIVKFVHKLK